jgi:KaiC/GvpD/RAD55 family RecA-like ATPase
VASLENGCEVIPRDATLDEVQAAFDTIKAANENGTSPQVNAGARAEAEANHVPAAIVGAPPIGAMVGDIAKQNRKSVRVYATGYPDLDAMLSGGLMTRRLTTVMGPPGGGKTAWVVDLAVRMQAAIPVLYVSLELEADELEARIAAPLLGVSWSEIVLGRVDRARVRDVLAGLRIRVISCEEIPRDGTLIGAIHYAAHVMTAEFGVAPLLIVDYLQELARGTDEKSLRAKIGDIATGLRALSQNLDCPLLAVSSISRAFYSADRREKMREAKDASVYLAAAKESGDVDFAAAVVLFLDVDDEIDGQGFRLAQIAVAKARLGRAGGFAGARFHGATGKWVSAPDAATALGDDSRLTARRQAKQASDDATHEAKVLEVVARLRAKAKDALGRSQLMSKSDLKSQCGIRTEAANKAIGRLLSDGRLIQIEESYDTVVNKSANLTKTKTRNVIDLATVPGTIS